MQIDKKYNKPFQRWFILGTAGKYYLLSEGGDCVLDLQGGVYYSGANAELCKFNNSAAQQFSIVKRNKSIIVLGNPVDIGTGFYARIIITAHKKMLTNDNVNVSFRSDTGEESQIWLFNREDSGAYKITNCADDRLLEIQGGSAASQKNVEVYKSNNGDWQRWYIYGTAGSYFLKPKNGDFMLDLQGGNFFEGVNAEIYNYNGTDAQKFTITKINKTAAYTISYDMNGGTGTIANQRKTNDIALTLSSIQPTKTGYTFVGWNTDKNATTAQYKPGDKYTANSSITLYAVWTGHIMQEAEAAGKTIPDGDYYIVSEINQDYFVDIPGDNFDTTDGKNVQMWTWDSSMPLKEGYDCFHIEYLNNGFYKIKQINTNMCLDSKGNSAIKGANVQMWTDNGNNAQQWSIERTSHGYRLRARCSGFYLDVVDGKHESCTNLRCWEGNNSKAQSFSFIPRNLNEYPISDGNYTIKTNVNKSSLLDVSGNPGQYKSGANVQIWNGGEEVYTIKNAGDGWYKIYEKSSGLIVEATISNSDFLNDSKNVQLANDSGTKNQLWKLRKNSDGTYFIINKAAGYYLDLSNSKTDNGTNVLQHQYNGNNNQRWIIELETYTVSYNLNGGNGTIANQIKKYGRNYSVP